jgi:hypothetical protein
MDHAGILPGGRLLRCLDSLRVLPPGEGAFLAGWAGYLNQFLAFLLRPCVNAITPFLPLWVLVRNQIRAKQASAVMILLLLIVGMVSSLFLSYQDLRKRDWEYAFLKGVSYRMDGLASRHQWDQSVKALLALQPTGSSGSIEPSALPEFARQFDRNVPPICIWDTRGESHYIALSWRVPLGAVILRCSLPAGSPEAGGYSGTRLDYGQGSTLLYSSR